MLAQKTYTPLGFFFLTEPPTNDDLPIPYYRTMIAGNPLKPSIDLIDTLNNMRLRQQWMREFLTSEGVEPIGFVGRARRDMPILDIVKILRDALGLAVDWATEEQSWESALHKLVTSAERAGILVVVNGIVGFNSHRPLDPEEFRGFALVDNYAPLIFVNGKDAKAAQMFTIAHELAHVVLRQSAIFDLRNMQASEDPVEQLCNQVAAEFLVPSERLQRYFNVAMPIQVLSRHFKVSELVIARRTLDLGLIKRPQFFEFYEAYRSRESLGRKESGGNFHSTARYRIGLPFSHAIVQAVREGTTLYSEAYRLTGLRGETFEKYAKFIADVGKDG
jgi:Zn-dependent peptidase ImmA (M78 family)